MAGRKVGKSELAAAIALYLLYADNEPSAEVYGAAADRQQASMSIVRMQTTEHLLLDLGLYCLELEHLDYGKTCRSEYS